MLQNEIESQLGQYHDTYLEKDWLAAKVIKSVQVLSNEVVIEMTLGYPTEGIKEERRAELTKLLEPLIADRKVTVKWITQIDAHVGRPGMALLKNVKNIIAVASGKGGVGKSTIAINLACALAKEGGRVGILDADIYGPSLPTLLGTAGTKPIIQDRSIEPIERYGIQSMSIGYLVDANAAMVWRGPMLGKALEQLMHDTKWDALDYLIVDLPPGTGDVQLTLCQKMPVSGAVVVTTPQDLALLDVRRACEMFNKLNVPLLGVVENMSVYHCPHCGHEEKIFGEGGGKKLAQEFDLTMLPSIPLDLSIREMTDSGCPPVVKEPESRYAKTFCEMARKVAGRLALQAKAYSLNIPKVVVEHSTGKR